MIDRLRRPVRRVRSRPSRARRILVALVVLAAVAAGWYGWSWWSAAHDEELALATTRDTVLHEATEALVTLNTVDYHTAERDVGRWVEVSTGRFGSEIAERKGEQVKQVRQGKTVATASVTNAAVTELHKRKGTAHVMAVLDIRVRGKGDQKQARHSLLEVQLTRAEHTWKVKSVQAAR